MATTSTTVVVVSRWAMREAASLDGARDRGHSLGGVDGMQCTKVGQWGRC